MLVNINNTDFKHCINNEHTCNDSECCSESSTVFEVRDQEEVEGNLCYSHKKVSIHAMVLVFNCHEKHFFLFYQACHLSGRFWISRIATLQHWIFFIFVDVPYIFLEKSEVIFPFFWNKTTAVVACLFYRISRLSCLYLFLFLCFSRFVCGYVHVCSCICEKSEWEIVV